MRFELIDAAKKDFPVQRLCKVLGVNPSGYFAWKGRAASRRQRDDLVVLAHVRSAFMTSNETYGSPRMLHELRAKGHMLGRRRVARLKKELALSALCRAIAIRRPPAGLIHHADRGSQYCSLEYQALLRKHGIPISMSGKENCYGNSMVESFFKTLKSELVWRTIFQIRTDATAAIGRYIDGFYNPVRRHSALNVISPLQFERQAA